MSTPKTHGSRTTTSTGLYMQSTGLQYRDGSVINRSQGFDQAERYLFLVGRCSSPIWEIKSELNVLDLKDGFRPAKQSGLNSTYTLTFITLSHQHAT